MPFANIRAFKTHPFRLYTGERLKDMVDSIRRNGILMPPIVRAIKDTSGYNYEMLSGHNRMNAASLAGLSGTLCLVKEELSDDEALMYVIETNLQQRSFTDLLPSEKAAVLAMRYSGMFSQGKRNDIIQELRLLEMPNAVGETLGTEFQRLNSRDSLGREYELSGRAVASYLRIDKLTEPLKLRLDSNGMTLKAGVAISYLDEAAQQSIENALLNYSVKLTESQRCALRTAASKGALTAQDIESVLKGKDAKPFASIRIKREAYEPYFEKNTPAKDIEKVICEALRLFFSQPKTSAE